MDLFIKQLIPFHLTLVTMHQHLHIYYYYSIQEKLFYFRYFIFVTLIKVVQHSIFAFYSPSTRLWKVLLVDILQIGGLPPKSNLILVASLLLGGYFLHLNFFLSRSLRFGHCQRFAGETTQCANHFQEIKKSTKHLRLHSKILLHRTQSSSTFCPFQCRFHCSHRVNRPFSNTATFLFVFYLNFSCYYWRN